MMRAQLSVSLFGWSLGLFIPGCGGFIEFPDPTQAAVPTESRPLEPDELTLPKKDDASPWQVGQAAKAARFPSVRFGKYLPTGARIWGAAIAPRAGKGILTYMDPKNPENKNATKALFFDLARGKVTTAWPVNDMLAPFAIHSSGKHALFCRKDGYLSERETLYLAGRGPDDKPQMIAWQPLVPDGEPAKSFHRDYEIRWACFAGEDRIVTLNKKGTLHIWDLHSRNRLGVFYGVKGFPALTPDGNKVGLVTDGMIALLNPQSLAIERATRLTIVPQDPVVAFHPDGTLLTVAGKGQAAIVDLESGAVGQAMLDRFSVSQGMELLPDLAWAGNYLYEGGRLYDLDSTIPVWQFSGTEWSLPIGRSLWAVVKTKKRSTTKYREYVLRSFKIPAREIETRVAKMFRNTDVVALQPGDSVEVDVSGLPEHRQQEIQRTLELRLAELGYQPSPSAAVRLVATVGKETEKQVTYQDYFRGTRERRTYSYISQLTKLEFIKNDRVLWSASGYKKPPYSLFDFPPGDTLPEAGGPDWQLFEKHRLPSFLRGDRGHTGGRTTLWAEGMQTSTS